MVEISEIIGEDHGYASNVNDDDDDDDTSNGYESNGNESNENDDTSKKEAKSRVEEDEAEKSRVEEDEAEKEESKEKLVEEAVVAAENNAVTIPVDIVLVILQKLGRLYYPVFSLISHEMANRINSAHFQNQNTGKLETLVYALLAFADKKPRWFVVNASYRLGQIDSIPDMPEGSGIVTYGEKIYVIGGCLGRSWTNSILLIDCKKHSCHILPSMKIPRYRPATCVIDGKIYVVGGVTDIRDPDWIEVYTIETQTWSTFPPPMFPVAFGTPFKTWALLHDKLFILDYPQVLVFDPKNKWSNWSKFEAGGTIVTFWKICSAGDDEGWLYTMDLSSSAEYPIIVCNTNTMDWYPVEGIKIGSGDGELPSHIDYKESKMVCFQGKLVLFGASNAGSSNARGESEVWCIEIALTRQVHGIDILNPNEVVEIQGKILRIELVFKTPQKAVSIEDCRGV